MTLFERIRRARELARVKEEARQITIRNRREPSLNEQNAVYRPPGHGLFFCPHNNHYFTACKACKRTHDDGQRRLNLFIEKAIALKERKAKESSQQPA